MEDSALSRHVHKSLPPQLVPVLLLLLSVLFGTLLYQGHPYEALLLLSLPAVIALTLFWNRPQPAAQPEVESLIEGRIESEPQPERPVHYPLLEAIPDGLCLVDATGGILYANASAARALGAEAATLQGKPLASFFVEGTAQAAGIALMRRLDGSTFSAESALNPVALPGNRDLDTQDSGDLGTALFSFRDISQRLAAEKRKSEFVATVSHELRTPLTSIRGALGLLNSGILGELDPKAAHLLRIAQSNSDRLVHLINDILDLERIQSGRAHLNLRPVELRDVVRQAIEGIQPVADEAGVHLQAMGEAGTIVADPDRLLQILTNLLSNAVKFSPVGASVKVQLSEQEGGIRLAVIDRGRGIPADKLEAIFGRFQQVEASDARLKGGSGLGLAICRTLVEQHGGRIWAESTSGSGATFCLFLPHRPAEASA